MRLDRYLSNSGIGTRKEVKQYIKKGLVKVNDKIVTQDGFNVDEYQDAIYFEDEKIEYHEFYYILLNFLSVKRIVSSKRSICESYISSYV